MANSTATAIQAPRRIYTRADIAMDTVVTLNVETAWPAEAVEPSLVRALGWFAYVERTCSRFDPDSELVRLCSRWGEAVPVSNLLIEAVAFALEVAQLTDGAFDPTVGNAQVRRGFDRNYVTGRPVRPSGPAGPASYRDVVIDRDEGTITLRTALLLDLGAVAKGLAIDLAARELAGFERYAVEAGGDLYAGGSNPEADAWQVAIRDPRNPEMLLTTVAVFNEAICSSGGYERGARATGEHHLLDPRSGRSPLAVAGVSAVAPSAMVADALATAAFVLGVDTGLQLFENGIEGIIVTVGGSLYRTTGLKETRA